MDIQRTDFSTAARLGIVLSIIGVSMALALGTVSQTTQVALILSTMLIAFVSSLVLTGRRKQPSVEPTTMSTLDPASAAAA